MERVSEGPSDSTLGDPRNTDVILLVMGATGAGKSTFINKLLDQDVAEVKHDMSSEKSQIQHYFLSHPNDQDHRLVVLDTPGFNETPNEELEILKRIVAWLSRSYRGNYTILGVIYLHEIQQARIRRETDQYLDVFNKLCGLDITKNLILATTKWDETMLERAERNETLLEKHWGHLIQRGSSMHRFENTQSSARAIVDSILQLKPISPTQIPPSDVNIRKDTSLNAEITKDSGIMILLLGDTGVGKSTFINTAAGQPIAEVNHDLTPACEIVVRHFVIQHPKHPTRCIFVDTPGFDNYHARDDEILERILSWLKSSCRSDASFGGIVYLHDITKPRTRSTIGAFSLLGLSCPEPTRHVLMTTVKWGKARQGDCAEDREGELRKESWKKILDGGAKTCRFVDTDVSAWAIVDTLLQVEPLELDAVQQALDRIYRFMPKKAPRRKAGFFASLFDRVLAR